MSSSEEDHHQNDSQCPQCKKKYISSSQNQQNSQSQSNQRIIIPLRKDLLTSPPPPQASPINDQFHLTLKTLQSQIENLKQSNIQKDKMIDDLKKQMEHKITHYMIYGEINKQADELHRLKTQISYNSNVHTSRKVNDYNLNYNDSRVREIVKQESQRIMDRLGDRADRDRFDFNLKTNRDKNEYRRKTHSTLDNYNSLKKQFLSPKNPTQKPILIEYQKQYFNSPKAKKPFNISEAKQKMQDLQQKIKLYQNELKWMTNFINTFIRSMQGLAYKKYQEQIIIPEWDLKKKAKVTWRYLKHVIGFLYEEPETV